MSAHLVPLSRLILPDSMMGCKSLERACHQSLWVDGADKGIIPLTTSELFRRVEERSAQDSNLTYTVEVSYIEIYNEKSVLRPCLILTG